MTQTELHAHYTLRLCAGTAELVSRGPDFLLRQGNVEHGVSREVAGLLLRRNHIEAAGDDTFSTLWRLTALGWEASKEWLP